MKTPAERMHEYLSEKRPLLEEAQEKIREAITYGPEVTITLDDNTKSILIEPHSWILAGSYLEDIADVMKTIPGLSWFVHVQQQRTENEDEKLAVVIH